MNPEICLKPGDIMASRDESIKTRRLLKVRMTNRGKDLVRTVDRGDYDMFLMNMFDSFMNTSVKLLDLCDSIILENEDCSPNKTEDWEYRFKCYNQIENIVTKFKNHRVDTIPFYSFAKKEKVEVDAKKEIMDQAIDILKRDFKLQSSRMSLWKRLEKIEDEVQRNHKEKSNVSEKCVTSQIEENNESLQTHLLKNEFVELDEDPFSCEHCGRRFSVGYTLQIHLELEHGGLIKKRKALNLLKFFLNM